MSRQGDAKIKQGYVEKYEPMFCMNCKHFSSKKEVINGTFGDYEKESGIKCSIGGFVVKKKGTCDSWEIAK